MTVTTPGVMLTFLVRVPRSTLESSNRGRWTMNFRHQRAELSREALRRTPERRSTDHLACLIQDWMKACLQACGTKTFSDGCAPFVVVVPSLLSRNDICYSSAVTHTPSLSECRPTRGFSFRGTSCLRRHVFSLFFFLHRFGSPRIRP